MSVVPEAFLTLIDPAQRQARLESTRRSLEAASGFSLVSDELEARAVQTDAFISGVVRNMIQMGKVEGRYDPSIIYPGEVVDDKKE